MRLLLGLVEAGLFPGLTIYLTFFYTRRELALRIGYLFVAAALAGACGGLLAYAIGHMDGIAGQRGWRWIMIIGKQASCLESLNISLKSDTEGLPTIIMGVLTFFLLPDNPESAHYLNEEERRFMVHRLQRDASATKSAMQFHWKDVKACFEGQVLTHPWFSSFTNTIIDPKCWLFAFAQYGVDTMLCALSSYSFTTSVLILHIFTKMATLPSSRQ
jgi:MFS family permease